MSITKTEIPKNSLIMNVLQQTHYSDCFFITIHSNQYINTTDCIRCIFYHIPPWVDFLMRVRNILVKPFGLKTSEQKNKYGKIIPVINCIKGEYVDVFEVVDSNENETVLSIRDKHLDACLALNLNNTADYYEIWLSTTVFFHNKSGIIYFNCIRLFHGLVVKAMLKRLKKEFSNNL